MGHFRKICARGHDLFTTRIKTGGHYRCSKCVVIQAKSRSPRKLTAEQHRVKALRRKYGISVEEFDRMLASQGGACAICGSDKGRRLHVDHDHATGVLRALLCQACNQAIGLMEDNPFYLRSAANYLEKHGTNASPEGGETSLTN